VTEWATSACTMLAPEVSAAVSLACAVLVVILVAAVLLGFGPLRARLDGPSTRPASRAELDSDAGLLSIWQVYHHLDDAERRPRPSRRAEFTTIDRTYHHRTEAQSR
jgi:hypothetical protein